ncbi:hypothetical protein K2P96_00635 [Patescibacteria group bacterium]|nr:hypothetical protein [Patescibacteria group bacterium]
MINLIPNQEKKRKVKDFYFRLVVVSFFILGLCSLVACVALLPSYFLSTVKKNLVSSKLDTQQKQPIPPAGQNTLATVADVASKLNLIETTEKTNYLVSEKVINEIVLHKMPDIKITEFSYENNTTSGKKVVVHGIAPSRERLLIFRKSLEDDAAFKKVDLPIQNFVKGSNITFYINIVPA